MKDGAGSNPGPFLMKKLLDRDPLTGIQNWFHSDGENHTIYSEQDIEPALEASMVLRNDDEHWKAGVNDGLVHYAHIPTTILEQWLRQGVNINDTKELFRMVNQNQYLKLTRKRHT